MRGKKKRRKTKRGRRKKGKNNKYLGRKNEKWGSFLIEGGKKGNGRKK